MFICSVFTLTRELALRSDSSVEWSSLVTLVALFFQWFKSAFSLAISTFLSDSRSSASCSCDLTVVNSALNKQHFQEYTQHFVVFKMSSSTYLPATCRDNHQLHKCYEDWCIFGRIFDLADMLLKLNIMVCSHQLNSYRSCSTKLLLVWVWRHSTN